MCLETARVLLVNVLPPRARAVLLVALLVFWRMLFTGRGGSVASGGREERKKERVVRMCYVCVMMME